MAEDHRGRDLAPRSYHDNGLHYGPGPAAPATAAPTTTPTITVKEEDRDSNNRPYPPPPPRMAAGVSLPPLSAMQASMQDYSSFAGRPGGHQPPPLEPRSRSSYSVSPTDSGSYPSSASGQVSLPPVNAVDPRGVGVGPPPPPPPQDPRQPYRPPPPSEPNHYYPQVGPQRTQPYPHDAYSPYYRPQQGHGAMAQYPDYRNGGMAAQQSSAPRQRTSIACRYCRKRKIRCSGYQNEVDGKCINCKKTGNECVFQPVSSSATTAFVPVSAIPGGVAPGTPLYGAFGQPLAHPGGHPGAPPPPHAQVHPQQPPQQLPPHPSAVHPHAPHPYAHHQQHPQALPLHPGHPQLQQQQQPPPPPHPAYNHQQTPPQLPIPSPTGSFNLEDRELSRRRARGPEDDQHGPRLPPPLPHATEDDPRRRSPASAQSNTPPMGYPPYARTQSSTPPISYPPPDQRAAQAAMGSISSISSSSSGNAMPPRRDSPASAVSTNTTTGPPPPPATNGVSSIMSLGNLIDHAPPRSGAGGDGRDNIDSLMLGRLGRRA